jgi:hypothetical protein
LSFAFLVLGLLAKPMLVTLPFLLLLMDYWPLTRDRADSNGLPSCRCVPGATEILETTQLHPLESAFGGVKLRVWCRARLRLNPIKHNLTFSHAEQRQGDPI